MSFEEIREAIIENKIKDVEDLIEAHPGIVNIQNESRESPLYMAAYFGHLDIVELLVEKGAHINHKDAKGGWTALSIAAIRGNNHVVEYLIIEGANLNEKTLHGDTALMLSCYKNKEHSHLKIIVFLLQAGADVTIKNNDGQDAMFYVEENKDEFVSQLIREFDEILADAYVLDIVPLNKSRIPETAEDVINMDHVNIQDFLAETTQNKVIKVADSFYTVNSKDIKKHYLRKKHQINFVFYPCKREILPPAIGVGIDDVYLDKPLFSASYIVGILSDFILFGEVESMVESKNQYFEIITHGPDVENIPATASAQMLTSQASVVGANHCQPGKEAKILKLKMINIVEDAEEAAVVKSISRALSEKAEGEAEAEGKGKRKRRGTNKRRRSIKRFNYISRKRRRHVSKKRRGQKRRRHVSKKIIEPSFI
jgi:hypothetical protein